MWAADPAPCHSALKTQIISQLVPSVSESFWNIEVIVSTRATIAVQPNLANESNIARSCLGQSDATSVCRPGGAQVSRMHGPPAPFQDQPAGALHADWECISFSSDGHAMYLSQYDITCLMVLPTRAPGRHSPTSSNECNEEY